MSYCRWSSDNWRSDLYCYKSDAGYETHVASLRLMDEIPSLPDLKDPDWPAALERQLRAVDAARCKRIGLPFDSMSFTDYSLEEFMERLTQLREVGYHIPDYVFEEVRLEMAEAKGGEQGDASM